MTDMILSNLIKNPIVLGVVFVVFVVCIIIAVFIIRSSKSYDEKTLKETFISTFSNPSDTFALQTINEHDKEIIEYFPVSEMNVMYSDSNGNLATTQDLGIKNLTVSSDSQFSGNVRAASANVVGALSAGSISTGGNVRAASTNVIGELSAGSISTGGTASVTGLLSAGSISTGGTASVTGLLSTGSISTGGNASITGALSAGSAVVTNNINTSSGKIQENGNALVPYGVIVMWNGSADAVPAGWSLCNGQNGTPDLRDRFIVGAGSDAKGGSYRLGDTGGSSSVVLGVNNLPAHNHTINDPGRIQHKHEIVNKYKASISTENLSNLANSSILAAAISVNNTGGNEAHENRPPYYALCYIMKL